MFELTEEQPTTSKEDRSKESEFFRVFEGLSDSSIEAVANYIATTATTTEKTSRLYEQLNYWKEKGRI